MKKSRGGKPNGPKSANLTDHEINVIKKNSQKMAES